MSLSIHGIRLPASGTPPKFSIGSVPSVCLPSTLRSISRIADAGSASRSLTSALIEPELRQQLAHVLRAAARGRLVGHAGHPLDEVVLEQAVHAHQHAAHRAIAADVVLDSLRQRVLDDRQVHRVEHDDGVVVHAQRLGGVDPVAVPAGGAQLRDRSRWCNRCPGRRSGCRWRPAPSDRARPRPAARLLPIAGPLPPTWDVEKNAARSGRSRARRACAPSAPSRPCRANRSIPTFLIASA